MTLKPRRFGPVARAGDIPLKPEEYRLIRDLVSERLGLFFGPELRSSLERRLRDRLGVRGLSSFTDYYQLLKYSPLGAEEWEEAAELLTTHETYFFREDYQLRAFQHEILPALSKKERKRIQIWSAGCSTGEEAYTIAMLILDSGLFEPLADWEIRVHGSDLSKKCIAAARRGMYGGSSFRVTDAEAKSRWFVPSVTEEGKSGVAQTARSLCHFAQMNLLDQERTALVGKCDVIFCRNVVLYFEPAARKRVIDMFYEQLVPGGVLLLGHAESLLNVSTAFELLHLKEDLVYKKPNAAGTK